MLTTTHILMATLTASAVTLAAGPAFADDLLVPDQISTIQEAIDLSQPGDRILLAPGEYATNVDIQNRFALSIIGSEGVILTGQAFIRDSDDIRISGIHWRGTLDIDTSRRIVLSEMLVFDVLNDDLATIVGVRNSSDVALENCKVTREGGPLGIHIGIGIQRSQSVQVSECSISNMFVPFEVSQSAFVQVVASRVVAGQQEFCVADVADSTAVNLNGNLFAHTVLTVERNTGVKVGGNRLTSCEILARDSAEVEVSGNRFRRAPRQANVQATMFLQNTPGAFVTGNRFRRTLNNSGIAIDSSGVTVELNDMKRGGARGIHLFQGGNTIRSNTVTRSFEFDFFDESGGQNELDDNTFGTSNL